MGLRTDFEQEHEETLSLGGSEGTPPGGGTETPRRGEVLAGKYRIEEVLGVGGMGVVLSATHLRHGGPVAVKLLSKKSWSLSARVLQEARAVAALRSPRVVRLLDVDQLPSGEPFLVFERLRGASLAQVLEEQGAIPWRVAVRYLLDACEGLAEAHAAGVIHRDIKPSNLFLCDEPPDSARIKVIDFGVARIPSGESSVVSLTGEDGLLGSLPYAAPEQLRSSRRVGATADVWSLGVTLFELISGRLPFCEQTAAGLAAAIACDEPPRLRDLNREIPASLDALVRDCLRKTPERRPADAGALAKKLRGVLAARRSPAVWFGLLALTLLGARSLTQDSPAGLAAGSQTPSSPASVFPRSLAPAESSAQSNPGEVPPSSVASSPPALGPLSPSKVVTPKKPAPRPESSSAVSSAVPRHEIENWSRK